MKTEASHGLPATYNHSVMNIHISLGPLLWPWPLSGSRLKWDMHIHNIVIIRSRVPPRRFLHWIFNNYSGRELCSPERTQIIPVISSERRNLLLSLLAQHVL